MKLKNLLLWALAAGAIFVSCKEEEELLPASLKTDTESVTIDLEGGSQTFQIKATRDWTATVTPENSGFEVAPLSGNGSSDPQTITVTAAKNTEGNRNAVITFSSASNLTAVVSLSQAGEKGNLMTVASVYNAAAESEVKVEGLVMAVNNSSYVLKDDTGLLLVYGGTEAEGPGAAVGDKVMVTGTVGSYGDLVQVVAPTTTVLSSGNEVNHGEALAVTAENIASANRTSVYYLELTGLYTVSGSYHNVVIEGATVQGSLSYPQASLGLADCAGHNVKFYGYFAGGNNAKYFNLLVSSFEDLGEPELAASAISDVLALDLTQEDLPSMKLEGTVMAKVKKGFILADATGNIYVYTNSLPEVAVGNKVAVVGIPTSYYGTPQLGNPTVTVTDDSTVPPTYGEAKDLTTVDALNSFTAMPESNLLNIEYVKVTGTFNADYSITQADGANYAVRLYNAIEDYSDFEGATVTVTGYYYNYFSSDKRICLAPVVFEAAPFLLADSNTINVSASATSAKIEVKSNVAWTISTEADWVTLGANSGTGATTVEVTFTANESATDARTAEFKLSAEGLSDVTVTLTQKKVEAAAAWTKVTSLDAITAGSYVITFKHSEDNNNYAMQNAVIAKNPVGEQVTITGDQITSEVGDGIIWTFTGNNTDGFVVSAGANYLTSKDEAQGISIDTSSSSSKWYITNDADNGFLMQRKDQTIARYVACYYASSSGVYTFRYYSVGSSYKGTLELYKKSE